MKSTMSEDKFRKFKTRYCNARRKLLHKNRHSSVTPAMDISEDENEVLA